jgi:hypothetical protein
MLRVLSFLYSAFHLVEIFLLSGKLLAFIVLTLGSVYGKNLNGHDRSPAK